MATRVWISSTGDVNATASYSGGALPIDGDRLVFCDNGAVAPSSNLTALVLIDLASFEVVDFPHAIGSSSTPFQSASLIYNIKGPGSVCIDHQSVATCAAYVASRNPDEGFRLHSNSVSTALTVTSFSGMTIISAAIAALRITRTGNFGSATVDHTAGTITNLYQSSGHYKSTATGVATNYYKGGGSAKFSGTTSNVSTLLFHMGGTFDYQSTSATTIGSIYAMGGGISFENAKNTVGITNRYVSSGATFKQNTRLVTISGVDWVLDDQLAHGPVP